MYGAFSDSGPGSKTYTVQNYYPTVSYSKTVTSGIAWTLSGTRTGVVTLGYHSKLANGELLPQNIFGFVKRHSTATMGLSVSTTYRTNGRLGSVTTSYGVLANPNSYALAVSELVTPAELAMLQIQAETKLRLKLKDTSANVAVAAAEANQAFKMIGDRLSSLRRSYSALKRGDLVGAVKALGNHDVRFSKEVTRLFKRGDPKKAINQAILEIQYGWRPLISDIYGAVEHLDRRSRLSQPIIKIQSRASLNKTVTTVNVITGGSSTVTDIARRDITIACLYKPSNRVLAELNSLGLTNLALVAWEKIPWSFVVDWFAHVGNFLSQFDSTVGWEFVSGYRTTFDETKQITKTQQAYWKTEYNYVFTEKEASALKIDVSRVSLASTPIAILPVIKNPISLDHALNSSALLFQTLRK